jgi:cysteine desulfuration protein SufE
MTVADRQKELILEFSALPGWEDRYKRLIEFGKALPALPKEYYDEKYKVRGCQSQVWLHAEPMPDGRVRFMADSDALIVKGLVALLVRVYSEAKPGEILTASPQFLKDLGFEGHLSPSRANGLYAMLKQILLYATAFQALQSQKP